MKTKVPEKGKKYGLLGGAFDPVHLGHTQLAIDIKNARSLDGVFCIPSYAHPFKNQNEKADYIDRLAMLERATEPYCELMVWELEKEHNLSGYTIDTVKKIKELYPESEFYFIIGADNINSFNTWHNPDEIIKEIKIIAGSRPDSIVDIAEYADYIEYIETSLLDISSTAVKKLIRESGYTEKLLDFVHPKVFEYIRKRKLYL